MRKYANGSDIQVIINGHLPIIIEALTDSGDASGPLERHREDASIRGYEDEPLLMRLQSGNRLGYPQAQAAGCVVITRSQFFGIGLSVSGWKASNESSIFNEFFMHLRARDKQAGEYDFTPIAQWHEIFPDSVLAVALLDRLLHHSTTINIRGDSYRQRHRKHTGLPQTINLEDTMT